MQDSSNFKLAFRSPIPQFLPDQFCGIGARLRTELLNASVEHLGEVQISFLIRRDGMRTIELTGLTTRATPAVKIVAVQVVLTNSVVETVIVPKVMVGRNLMSRRW